MLWFVVTDYSDILVCHAYKILRLVIPAPCC